MGMLAGRKNISILLFLFLLVGASAFADADSATNPPSQNDYLYRTSVEIDENCQVHFLFENIETGWHMPLALEPAQLESALAMLPIEASPAHFKVALDYYYDVDVVLRGAGEASVLAVILTLLTRRVSFGKRVLRIFASSVAGGVVTWIERQISSDAEILVEKEKMEQKQNSLERFAIFEESVQESLQIVFQHLQKAEDCKSLSLYSKVSGKDYVTAMMAALLLGKQMTQ